MLEREQDAAGGGARQIGSARQIAIRLAPSEERGRLPREGDDVFGGIEGYAHARIVHLDARPGGLVLGEDVAQGRRRGRILRRIRGEHARRARDRVASSWGAAW